MYCSDLPSPLVDIGWLHAHLHEDDVVVLDASTGSVPAPQRVPGAAWFDHDVTMSAPDSDLPHTLPTTAGFQEQVRRLGVDDDSRVVVYDRVGIYSSARAWWMLKQAGHRAVSVLDGGLPAWVEAGFPTEPWPQHSDPTAAQIRGGFTATGDLHSRVVTAGQVGGRLDDGRFVIVDARARDRFAGEVSEPRPGLRSGHMPGAVNIPFTDLLQDGRIMRPRKELDRILADPVPPDAQVIASCGSGVTATVVLLACELTGRAGLLYDGSWSEWGRLGGGPVVRS